MWKYLDEYSKTGQVTRPQSRKAEAVFPSRRLDAPVLVKRRSQDSENKPNAASLSLQGSFKIN